MIEQKILLNKIRNKQQINQEEIIITPIIGDGNCFYRSISLYLTNEQSNHKIIREIIYEAAKERKEDLKPFFLTGIADDILTDAKLENYIELIKNDSFYAGIIELSLAANIFQKTIIVYLDDKSIDIAEIKQKENFYTKALNKTKNNNNNICEDNLEESKAKTEIIKYSHLTTIEKPNEKFESLEDIILLLYDRQIKHFSLILTKDLKNNIKFISTENQEYLEFEEYTNEEVKNFVKSHNRNFKKFKIHKSDYLEELNTNNYVKKKGFNNYYEDIYAFLISKEKAFNKETKKINWDNVIYPSYTKSPNLSKKQKDKKRENFRNKCDKFIISDNALYKKDKDYDKNKIKYRIPFEKEKIILIKKMHTDNGHLGANRTRDKIIESGFKWENMINDIIDYIKYECVECINRISGEKINTKIKVITTKGPKERYVIDGFQLDEITKSFTNYSYIIEILNI